GAGNVGSTAYVMVPTYAFSDSTMEDIAENMSAGGFFQIGATDNFDIGLFLGTAGIGAQGKLRLTPGRRTSKRRKSSRSRSTGRRSKRSSYNPFDAAAIFSVNYNLWRGGLIPKGDLVGSIRFGEYFSIYGGGQIFYAPKITETELINYVNRQLFFGFNVRRGEKVNPAMDWIPSSLYIEFGYPFDLEERAFLFGLGIGGANLPVLFGSCLGAMGD
ncbi:hypothetical protein KAU34_05630, partial [candidate division WOR-3 bacterium]|nr:hypothetical protein [candidate division WOR-3 bacterium]